MRSFQFAAIAAASAILGLAGATAQAALLKGQQAPQAQVSPGMQLVPSGKGFAVEAAALPGLKVPSGGNGINYHGGKVLVNGPNAYYIWYGDAWAGDTAMTILPAMMSATGGQPYFNINTSYFQGKLLATGKVKNPKYVANAVTLAGQTTVTSSSGTRWHGNSLSDAMIKTIVSEAISAGDLPSDTSGVYFVLTDKNVHETSGFCSSYCGWHYNGTIGGQDIKYSFVGNAISQCPSGCMVQSSKSPNNNPGADGMASVIMHELEEATTDPDVGGVAGLQYGWYDNASGGENADKCAWTFGTTYTTGNGSMANVNWGGSDYLIQQNWVNAKGGYCALSY